MQGSQAITTLKAHFDGKHIVLDEPPPPELVANTPVQVVLPVAAATEESVLDQIARLAVDNDELPPDFAEQHDHYVKGKPRR